MFVWSVLLKQTHVHLVEIVPYYKDFSYILFTSNCVLAKIWEGVIFYKVIIYYWLHY